MFEIKSNPGGTPWLLERGCWCSYLGSAIWGRRNYLGFEISMSQMCYPCSEIWGLIFLVCHCPRHCLCINFFWNSTADYLGSLKKLVWLFGVRKLLDISTPVRKCKNSPTPGNLTLHWHLIVHSPVMVLVSLLYSQCIQINTIIVNKVLQQAIVLPDCVTTSRLGPKKSSGEFWFAPAILNKY